MGLHRQWSVERLTIGRDRRTVVDLDLPRNREHRLLTQ